MQTKRSTLRDVAAAGFVIFALALPLLPMPGGGAAHMKVHFRTSAMAGPRDFTTQTSQRVCTAMAAALDYENPKTGEYTHVACSE